MTESLSNAVASFVATLAAFAYLGRNAIRDDADTTECHELVLDSLADADLVTKIDTITDRNLRDQLTLEDAMTLHEESKLSKMGARRN